MSRSSFERIKAILEDAFLDCEIMRESTLGSLDDDGLDVFDVVLMIEDEFEVELAIPDERFDSTTVGQLADQIDHVLRS